MPGFFEPPIESQNIVLVDRSKLRYAERFVVACEECSPVDAELPFVSVLDRVTGNDPAITDYIFETLAKCPRCRGEINERTLVKPHIVLNPPSIA